MVPSLRMILKMLFLRVELFSSSYAVIISCKLTGFKSNFASLISWLPTLLVRRAYLAREISVGLKICSLRLSSVTAA